MHPALAALEKFNDAPLQCMGYDKARTNGQLSAYLKMMNKSPNGGYTKRTVVSAKLHHLGFSQIVPTSSDRLRRMLIS